MTKYMNYKDDSQHYNLSRAYKLIREYAVLLLDA